MYVGGTKGIDPLLTVPQTAVLPLHQEPHLLVPAQGIEPWTYCL